MKRKGAAAIKGGCMIKAGLMLVMPALMASMALAGDGPSIEQGKELFNSTKLGTNGKSCATCHSDVKKLGNAATYDEGQLGDIINQCIENPLKGNALDPASRDMRSLIIYIKSFAKTR
jgi:cytochrome c peroxidase